MTRPYCLLAILTALSASAVAQRDLNAEFESIPDWPEDGVIPAELDSRYVFLDPDAGQMVLAYPADLGQDEFARDAGDFRVERFNLKNQVDASVSFDVRRNAPWFTYTYAVSNSAQARQAIRSVRMPATFGEVASIVGPPRWGAAASLWPVETNAVRLALGRPDGAFLSWYMRDSRAAPILPGGTLAGLSVTSRLKPGFTLAYVQGLTDRPGSGLREDMPEAVLDQANVLMQTEFNSQNVVTIAPKFAAGTPKLEIAEDFRRGIGRMVEAGQLDDRSPDVRRALEILERCVETAETPRDGSLAGCDLDSAFDARAMPGMEADVLNAMRLSLAD